MLFLIAIFLLLVIIFVILVFATQSDPVADVIRNEQIIKILFVLEDEHHEAIFTTVLGYYPRLRRGVLYDIPGNTGAIYASLGRVDRIDAVYREQGIEPYRLEIERLLGQEVPFSVVITIDAFVQLADYLGGLRVFVPSPIDAVSEHGERWLLPSGAVTLDGDKVRTYLSYTTEEDSLADIQERKQNTMLAVLSAFSENETLLFSKKAFRSLAPLFNANISSDDLRRLFEVVAQIDAERIITTTIIGSSRVVDGQTLLFPLYDGQLFKDSVKQTLSSLLSTSDTALNRVYVLEIQNGTMVQGLAHNTSTLLQGAGYDVLTTRNAERMDIEHTVIIDHIGNREASESLGNFINCTNIVADEISDVSDSDFQVDFTIILGSDFDGRYVR
ncbi:MAG TPA: LCP family protein [Candidatus Treponema faecavium]|nr:LCP family protein [Candidatus Treponema faecavium]